MKGFNAALAIFFIVALAGIVAFGNNVTGTPISEEEFLMDLSQYVNYSESNLAQSQTRGQSVLFFAATAWCQSCSKLEKEIKENASKIPANMTILKVDYDNDKAMNKKYDVVVQHTLVLLDESGKELKRWVGLGFDELLAQVNRV